MRYDGVVRCMVAELFGGELDGERVVIPCPPPPMLRFPRPLPQAGLTQREMMDPDAYRILEYHRGEPSGPAGVVSVTQEVLDASPPPLADMVIHLAGTSCVAVPYRLEAT